MIDVNLPYYFSTWNSPEFLHLKDIGETWTDDQVWSYGKMNNLTIITKDADFSNRMMVSTPPPKVIHIRFGNLKMKEFHMRISKVWQEVVSLNTTHKLINIFLDRIEAIG
ncbi:MAG: DUF5615 family PIN-like protein [Chloroherpetonaceae bacterium]